MRTSSTPNDLIRPDYSLRVLGSPAELLVNGSPHIFTNRKHLAILAYLVIEQGEYPREQLARFVWYSGAAGSIDNAISELRSAFGPGVIPPRVRKIVFDPTLVDVDALRLLSAVDDPGLRAQAIASYRGPFLEDFNTRGNAESFVRWVQKTRDRLEMVFRLLCEQECEAAAAERDWQRVRSTAELGVRKSPGWAGAEQWQEAAARALRTGGERAQDGEATHDVGKEERAEHVPSSMPRPHRDSQIEQTPQRIGWGFVALATGAAAVLTVFLIGLLLRGDFGRPEPLVRMPPVRANDLPAPGSPLRQLSDWLRTDGRWIYYRYERYMPGACRHSTVAAGNFGKTSWESGVPVACLNVAWLAVDGQQLMERYSLAPETTYCLQFLYVDDGTSVWGQHGAQRAPGLDSIRVVAPAGEYNIGFAVIRGSAGQQHIELTHRYPAARC